MKLATLAAVAAAIAFCQPAAAQAPKPGVEKLYIFNCGEGSAPDQSRWSTGVNVGKPIDFSDNCYLIKHARGWFLWDTGVVDAIADRAGGQPGENGGIGWKRPKKLAAQIEEIGIKPADVKFMAVSHTHPDHAGNIELFPQAMIYVQKAEYDWPLPLNLGRFKPEHPVTKLEGDYDVFGDGSIVLLSTPGHTPGHQSLLVKLPKTGALVLSGDAVHFGDNWENRRVPSFNFDVVKSAASLKRIEEVLAKEKATLWINHDKAQSATLKYSPAFYE